MTSEKLTALRQEIQTYLSGSLLPFWIQRTVDKENGGFITHFDQFGKDSGEDEKSLIAQSRSVFTYSSAVRAGYDTDGTLAEMARQGVDYLIDKMWDNEYGGFFWMTNRKGEVTIDEKIVYGLSFCIYSLSENLFLSILLILRVLLVKFLLSFLT